MTTGAGLSGKNREFMGELHRALPGPFTPADAAEALALEHRRAARLLRQLADQGWLVRLQRGLYSTIPLEAEDPARWIADPWAVASSALAPGYVGGWTALHHWDLTDQVFGTTVFVTTRPVPRRERQIAGSRFHLRHRPEAALFGTRRVWREGTPVTVSDPERTVVDCLDDPSVGAGLRHTADALVTYAEGAVVNWGRLVEYADRLGNRTVFKRLGYLAETLGLGDEALVGQCLARVSAGVGRLDPARPPVGPTSTRWGLRINAGVET